MSIYNRLYICRLAPCSEDWRDAIYSGVDVIHRGERFTESFAPDAFLASDKPVPVVLSHEDAKVVGHVTSRITNAGWHVAAFTLDHARSLSAVALDLLKVGAPVSIGFRPLRHDELLAKDGVMRHSLACLDEVSILRPDEIPAFRGARITSVLERAAKPSPPAVAASELPVGGEEILHAGGLLRRPAIGRVLGVR